MRKIFGLTAAMAIAAIASVATASETTGTVEEIDLPQGTILVEDQLFAVSDTNTVGATIEDLKEGDQVRVFFADSDSGDPINAMQVDKLEQ